MQKGYGIIPCVILVPNYAKFAVFQSLFKVEFSKGCNWRIILKIFCTGRYLNPNIWIDSHAG